MMVSKCVGKVVCDHGHEDLYAFPFVYLRFWFISVNVYSLRRFSRCNCFYYVS